MSRKNRPKSEWMSELASQMVSGGLTTLVGNGNHSFDDFQDYLAVLTQCLVASSALTVLSHVPSDLTDSRARYEFVQNNFAKFKAALTIAVAEGMSDAWFEYAGAEVEYLCRLNMIPEPSNKEPC